MNNESLWFCKEGEYLEIRLVNGIVTRGLLGLQGFDRYAATEHMRQLGWEPEA